MNRTILLTPEQILKHHFGENEGVTLIHLIRRAYKSGGKPAIVDDERKLKPLNKKKSPAKAKEYQLNIPEIERQLKPLGLKIEGGEIVHV